jgi:arylsulfatase
MERVSKKQKFMSIFGVLCLLVISTSYAEAKRPNFLLVMADDMGWTDVGCFGSGNMGEMLAPEQRGKPGYEGYLNNRVASLAEVLRTGGYHTYMAGKWHLGHEEYVLNGKRLEELPKDFYATRSYTDFLIESIRENRGDGKPFLAYLAFTTPHDPMHVPEPWLSKYRSKYDDGYEVLKEKRAAAAKRMELVSDSGKTPGRHQMLAAWDSLSKEQQSLESRGMEVYAGMVNNMDYHFGRVVKFLKDIGEYENTIVIFLSDNGPNPWNSEDYPGNRGSKWFARFDNSIDNLGHPMSHYAYGMGWGSACAGPLDLFKMTVGEGGIRSPLLITGPGVKGGRQVDAFAYIWDVMPTILEFADIPHPEKYKGRQVERMRGKSLKGVLTGSTKAVYGADELVGGEMQNGKWMRQGEAWHLYNLVDDPGETHDLANDEPETLKKLQAAWDRYAKDVGVVLTK